MEVNPQQHSHKPTQGQQQQAAQKASAEQFTEALRQASSINHAIVAASESQKSQFQKDKKQIETGKGMKQEEEDENELLEKLDSLKENLKNILEAEQRNIGL